MNTDIIAQNSEGKIELYHIVFVTSVTVTPVTENERKFMPTNDTPDKFLNLINFKNLIN